MRKRAAGAVLVGICGFLLFSGMMDLILGFTGREIRGAPIFLYPVFYLGGIQL